MKPTTAAVALLVAVAVLSSLLQVHSQVELPGTMIEGLQAGPATEQPTYDDCEYHCRHVDGCIAFSFNDNPDILQCLVFCCVNDLQPNEAWDSGIFINKPCSSDPTCDQTV